MTVQVNSEVSVDEFKRQFEFFLNGRDLDGNHRFYDSVEWKSKGETMCGEFVLHFISEGPFNHFMNYGDGLDLLQEFVERLGWCYEWGFSWSWHFAPMSLVGSWSGSVSVPEISR